MKEFLAYLIIGLIILLSIVIGIGYASADEVPNIQCNSGDIALDNKCMRDNWRPKKQISYDTGRPYCNREGQQLHGKGEIVLNVDDAAYSFKIDCP